MQPQVCEGEEQGFGITLEMGVKGEKELGNDIKQQLGLPSSPGKRGFGKGMKGNPGSELPP